MAASLLAACSSSSAPAPSTTATSDDGGTDAATVSFADGGDADVPLVPKGTRLLSIDNVDVAQGGVFDDNMRAVKAAGASVLPLHVTWSGIESTTPDDCTSPGTYLDPFNALATFDTIASQNGMKLSLTIGTVDTNQLTVPDRFRTTAFQGDAAVTARMVCRFEKMLDFVLSKLAHVDLVSLQIGNELDAYPAASTAVAFWSSYYDFFAAVSTYARNAHPGIRVGFTATWPGLMGRTANPLAKGGYAALMPASDVIAFTYYGTRDDFSVKPPSDVLADWESVLSLYPGTKPVFVEEAGYPTGSTTEGSSSSQQAEFVRSVFQEWDARANRIALVSFVRLVDYSHQKAIDTAAQFGSTAPAFVEYLETLGLRTHTGADKPAWTALLQSARARGF